jgi:hypothetical protein
MNPVVITPFQAWVAEVYWGRHWTYLSGAQVQHALDWYFGRLS